MKTYGELVIKKHFIKELPAVYATALGLRSAPSSYNKLATGAA
jgi:hypothetical protein